MKATTLLFICTNVLGATVASAQGDFLNLDFELASLSPVPSGEYGGFVPIGEALPWWTGYFGTSLVSEVLQNNMTLGSPGIDILGPNWSLGGIIEGNYTVVLQSGVVPPNPGVDVSLTQVGTVPLTAQSVQVKVSGSGFQGRRI